MSSSKNEGCDITKKWCSDPKEVVQSLATQLRMCCLRQGYKQRRAMLLAQQRPVQI